VLTLIVSFFFLVSDHQAFATNSQKGIKENRVIKKMNKSQISDYGMSKAPFTKPRCNSDKEN